MPRVRVNVFFENFEKYFHFGIVLNKVFIRRYSSKEFSNLENFSILRFDWNGLVLIFMLYFTL